MRHIPLQQGKVQCGLLVVVREGNHGQRNEAVQQLLARANTHTHRNSTSTSSSHHIKILASTSSRKTPPASAPPAARAHPPRTRWQFCVPRWKP